MDIKEAPQSYETWVAQYVDLIKEELDFKHQQMRTAAFPFLRATFYRWAQTFPVACPELMTASVVLGIGDLHIENFGTWRDAEGRLIWGVNDFDEACLLPYTNDLVRLAASACLAIAANRLSLDHKDGCVAILTGYLDGLKKGGRPFVLAERHKTLRDMALERLREPERFWQKMIALPKSESTPPAAAEAIMRTTLPDPNLTYQLVKRIAGLGSLGRPRYVALAEWCGGYLAREIKALAPSAVAWVNQAEAPIKLLYQDALNQAVRCPDPMIRLQDNWLIRRLAPDCSKIELASLAKAADQERLLEAMGKETANIHLGTEQAAQNILQDLNNRPPDWLHKAARKMVDLINQDWAEWAKV